MTILQNRFNEIDKNIQQVESQIAELQEKLSSLQEYKQQIQSVEQACQSAVDKIGNALTMINHVAPDQVEVFKSAVNAVFKSDVALLPQEQLSVDDEASPNPDNGPIITPVKSAAVDSVQSDGSSQGSVNRTSKSAGNSEDNLKDCQPQQQEKSETPTVERKQLHLANAGSMGFDPKLADFPALKDWVRSRTTDDEIRKFGSLRKRATWEEAAQMLMF